MSWASRTTVRLGWCYRMIMTTWDDVTTKKGKSKYWESITTPTRRNHYESCYRVFCTTRLETRATDGSIFPMLRNGHEPKHMHPQNPFRFSLPLLRLPEKDGKHCQLDRRRVQGSAPRVQINEQSALSINRAMTAGDDRVAPRWLGQFTRSRVDHAFWARSIEGR